MATFPSICPAEGMKRTARQGSKLVRIATNGQVRSRTMYNQTFEDPVLMFNDLSLAEVEEIKQFELDNKAIAFDVFWLPENITIQCVFAEPPYDFTPFKTGGDIRFRGQVNLVQQS